MERNCATRITSCLVLAIVLVLPKQTSDAAVLALDLGIAGNFAVLAGAGITVTAPVGSTEITGDIGSYATTTITGMENVILNGVNHAGDSVTQEAKGKLGEAYADAFGRLADVDFPLIHDAGGSTLVSGVYKAPSSLAISGILTLDGGGDADAVWIFQMGSTLTTATGSSVNLINGAQAGNVFWQVGSSATLGVDSVFQGSILAQDSITVATNAEITGRALAINGAVTLDNNIILVPETSISVLFALGLSLATLRRCRQR